MYIYDKSYYQKITKLTSLSVSRHHSPLPELSQRTNAEGLPGVLGNKGTMEKYRRDQGNMNLFEGTGEKLNVDVDGGRR